MPIIVLYHKWRTKLNELRPDERVTCAGYLPRPHKNTTSRQFLATFEGVILVLSRQV
jgi:hypothetical protein